MKSTPTITIKPPIPEIVDFKVENESVQTKPQRVFVINPALGTLEVALSWEVENAAAVEILPVPGLIEDNEIRYTLSAAPGAEAIVLRAVNEIGEEVTQSVLIEKVEFVPEAAVPFTNANQLPNGTTPENAINQTPVAPSISVPALEPGRQPPIAD